MCKVMELAPDSIRSIASLQNPFRKQESDGEFVVVSRSSHGNREVPISDANLQRLFDSDPVLIPRVRGSFGPHDGHCGNALLHAKSIASRPTSRALHAQ